MFAIRAPISALGGLTLSAAVFLGLWQLVSIPFEAGVTSSATKINFTRQRVDTPAESRREPKPIHEELVVEPNPPRLAHGDGRDDVVVDYRATQRIDPVFDRAGLSTSGIDGDITPIVRMNPDYPPRAAAAGTEGWVQVRFSVTTAGTVRDAAVVASEPGTTFDDAALKAIARWRYNPRVVDGVAVERVGLETLFRFELQ
jgi:protein TonB